MIYLNFQIVLILLFSLLNCFRFVVYILFCMKPAFILIFIILCFAVSAQKATPSNYKKYPVWINMMKDSNVNYFEALIAYETFWQGKKKPLEEDELIGQEKTKSTHFKKESHREIKEQKSEKEVYRIYGLACKKFEHWKLQVRPYVQGDGHILTAYQRLKFWKEQQQK